MDIGLIIPSGRPLRLHDFFSCKARLAFITVALLIFSCFTGSAQTLIVKWDFPNNPDDSIADGGIPANLLKYIGTRGGAGIPKFDYQGFTTNCAGAQQWENGANVKSWQVEFSTLSYSQLTIRSKSKSHHPQDFGPRDWNVEYRIGGGGAWTHLASFDIRKGNQWDSLVTTTLPVVCNNQPSLYIRWIMSSNTPTQGNGSVNTDAYNYIDDVVVLSGCVEPAVAATPASQTTCPRAAITPIVITNPNNVPGTTFSWTRDNTTVLTGIPASGTSNPVTGTLYSSAPQVFNTTIFTITANAAGCTSTTTAAVTVGDHTPPVFLNNSGAVHFCVQDIIQAFWNFAGDFIPVRPDWYTFHKGQTTFDLNPALFSDNCTPPANLILHWSINLVGGAIITGAGKISNYPQDILFPLGTSTIIYWLEDLAGNLTPSAQRRVVEVIVHARPDITRNF